MKKQMKDILVIACVTKRMAAVSCKKNTAIWTTGAVLRTGAATVLWGCVCWAPAYSGTIHVPFQGNYIFVPSETVSGGLPNALPFMETFDTYPVHFPFGTPAIGTLTNGWVKSSAGDQSWTVPVTELPVTPVGLSQFSGNCLSLSTEGGTLYNVTTGHAQNVWIDMSVLMVPSEEVPWTEMISGHQLGMCLDCNYRFNVYCGLTNGFLASGVQIASYPGQKFRLTLQIAYADNLTVPYFRVFIDQTNVIWNAGFSLPDIPSTSGGAWLPCATTNRIFNGLGLVGWANIDNLTFSDAYLGVDNQPQVGIEQAVAISWLTEYGRRYQVETSEDLASGEWQSFGDPILGDGTTNSIFDATGSVSRKFYRVTPF